MRIISPEWKHKMLALMDASNDIDEVIEPRMCQQWLIGELARRRMTYQVIELGAGVKRITQKTDICPKCNGTGKC